MSRPLRNELPKNSRLEFYVTRLLVDRQGWKESWPWEDERARAVGVAAILEEEPRIWMLDRALVRDELILPAIAKLDGAKAAEVVKRSCPNLLSEYVDLVCEQAKRDAPARKRLKPVPDISWATDTTVFAVLHCDFDQSKSLTANYTRTANLLGVDRHRIRRIDMRLRRHARSPGFLNAVLVVRERLAAYDQEPHKRIA